MGAAISRLTAIQSRLISHAETIEATDTISTAAWLAANTQVTHPRAHAQVGLAKDLGAHHHVRTAMVGGAVLPEQATVICEAVEKLPANAGMREKAERHLVEQAACHDAKALKILGRRCRVPAALCHAHHPTPWGRRGKTNRDGQLLCPRHHALAHHDSPMRT